MNAQNTIIRMPMQVVLKADDMDSLIYYGRVWGKVLKKSKKGGRYSPCIIGLVVWKYRQFSVSGASSMI